MRGLTLIETLIYLGLFSFLITGAITSLASIESGTERVEAASRLTDEGHFILERMRYEIERGTSIETAGSGLLRIVSDQGLVSFYLEEGTLVQEANGKAMPLSEPGTRLAELSFSAGPNEGVFVSITLEVRTRGGNPLIASFSQTVFPLSLP